jgi:hypothetical protein
MSEQKTDQPKINWQDWAARTTAILAVMAALSSGRWGASNLQAILEQGKVNDTWAYYQAKSIKQHAAESSRDLAASLAAGEPADRAAPLEKLAARLDEEARREEKEKNQRQHDAEQFQATRDHLVESSFWYEISFAFLQLGVILCTISSGAKLKPLLHIGIGCGLLGVVLLINGLHTFYPAHRGWYQSAAQNMEYRAGSGSK